MVCAKATKFVFLEQKARSIFRLFWSGIFDFGSWKGLEKVLIFPEKSVRTLNRINTKTIGNRKRDCAWGCAWGINTTWENMQIEQHKSVRWAERTPSWFVLFDLQISSGVYSPSATSRTISFLFPIVFGSNLIHFFDFFDEKEERCSGNSIVCFAASIPCQSRPLTVRRTQTVSKSATFLAMESVNSAPFKRGETEVQFFGKE